MELLEQIALLPVSKRIEIVEQIWDSIAAESGVLPLSPAQRDELAWRVANPSETTYSIEQVVERARAARQ